MLNLPLGRRSYVLDGFSELDVFGEGDSIACFGSLDAPIVIASGSVISGWLGQAPSLSTVFREHSFD